MQTTIICMKIEIDFDKKCQRALQRAAKQQFGKMASDMKMHIKLRRFIKFFQGKKIEIIEKNQRLLKVYGDQTI